jgi:uncharacterized protein YegL
MSTTVKTPQEELEALKKCNKKVREAKARKNGFATAALYMAALEGTIKGTPPKKPTEEKKVPNTRRTKTTTIHVVDILDSSGSMAGDKLTNALKGINKGIEELRDSTAKVKYTYSLCDFSDDVRFTYTKETLSNVDTVSGRARRSTALYDAIGSTIKRISEGLDPKDKVLVNIYTDGEENSSEEYDLKSVSAGIKEWSSKGWTFTFIGTERDVEFVIKKMHIHKSNTMSYDGTAKGLEKTLTATNVARSNYSQSVERGEDVSTGFYKDIK